MGYRLSKIYTKTGDDGTTGLGDGSRVAKDSVRVEAMGEIDELNSMLGLLLAEKVPESIESELTSIQHRLFDMGAELSIPNYVMLRDMDVSDLEQAIDKFNADLAPLQEFILPGGSKQASICHIARAICRRAERKLVTLKTGEAISEISLQYLNRLSDLLFVLSRCLNRHHDNNDVLWRRRDTSET